MIRSKFAFAASVTLLAAIAFPAGTAGASTTGNSNGDRGQTEANASRSDSNADERRICVREQLSGSHLTRRICKTAREWQAAGGVPGRDD